jgi:uncharacterized protein
MIFRLLILFLIVWFLIWLIKKQFTTNMDTDEQVDSRPAEDMVACAHCGTHVPKSLAIESHDKYYCCEQHVGLDE